ncbi:DUF29 domain-containing protein [Dolichospermum flos-aquae]|nr:DUF29 domain-containing protein [Dolichospermum flos-aquae]
MYQINPPLSFHETCPYSLREILNPEWFPS